MGTAMTTNALPLRPAPDRAARTDPQASPFNTPLLTER